MSTASNYAAIRAKFFPATRPIVMASPTLWEPKRPPPPRQTVRRMMAIGPEPKFPVTKVLPAPSRIVGIVKLACTLFGISKATLMGDARDSLVIKARTYAAWRLFHELGLSKSRIGIILNRDHSSIFNILERAAGRPGKIQRNKPRASRRALIDSAVRGG